MSAFCYIIFSHKLNRFYTGACHDNLDERIRKHNSHEYGSHRFTATTDDWVLFLAIPSKDYAHAIRMEKTIKAMKSSVFIKNLKKYPELQDKLFLKTSN